MTKKYISMGSWALALMLAGCEGATETPASAIAGKTSALDDGLVNVTLLKPATASHVQEDPFFPPEKAVDGNITADDSRWCPGPYRFAQRYLDIDLQGTFDLHRVELYTGYQDIRPVANYDLHYYDGTRWQPIPGAARTGNTSIAVSTTFTQVVRGQRVRFLCNEPNEENCRVKELWVFGLPATPGANQPPVANAGADRSVTLPSSGITLTGSATDADGTIVSYGWTQVSGPIATLAGANTATLSLTGLSAGTLVFRLTVTDDDGATHSDDVTLTVSAAPVNQAPVANAGPDVGVTLPTSSVTLTGSATDTDGTIAAYAWTQVSGPVATLANASTATLSVSGLGAGTFVFRLTVTDDDGATHSDDVTVTVSAAPANQPPVANAGADRSVALPSAGITLTGSATDSDGSVVSYAWTQVSGPVATLSGANTLSLSVSGLTAGTYVFRLTVTDDDGATHSDDVTVTATSADTLTNVVKGKPTTAMQASGSFPAARATDDNLTTRWETSVNPDRPGTYLDVDLQGAFELHSAEVHLGTSATATNAMKNFVLQSWDGGCWKTLPGATVSANPVATTVKSLTFTEPVVATKVRLLCLDSVYNPQDPNQTDPCVVRELKVQGKAAPSPTGAMSCPAGEQYAVRSARHGYAAFLPAGYNADRNARWPLVISLHGTGGVTLNSDLQSVATTPEGLAWNLQSATFRQTFGAIAVSPHFFRGAKTGNNAWFQSNRILSLLEDLQKDFLVDTDRVYVTGFSGGANTLYEEILLPNLSKFAAFVPISVTSTPANISGYCGFRTLPIWPFHGALDTQSSPEMSTDLKTKLETQCGGTTSAMKLPTIYANLGHDPQVCRNAYATQALWDWMFQQRVSTRGN
ncbi:discoidin domain-containing protein [Myxococcus sp. K15C18031901]|uniref:PKD domain-containing protein n=1 Tax=Myxococcus dinghuensis TaxID=2906761 RepID=UPI0020A6EE73|nr:discoidin domain-containing protein [Myxococcus dinghuensis]MCP3099730.1 discoidin domain-containing protein [Myxococcus dinghuensis]